MLRQVHEYADRRFGLVSREELRRFDLSDKQISALVQSGALLRRHRAVFRVPGSPPSPHQDALGACLAIGPHAFASHLTAARLWQITDRREDRPQVTVPASRRSEQATVQVFRSADIGPQHVTRIGVIPVTRVARTLSDLATVLNGDDLEEALDEALRRRIVTPAQLAKYPRLRKLAEDRIRYGVPRDKLERKAIAALRDAGLPEPVRQFELKIRGKTYYPDLCYPERKIAIELEGEAPHWGKNRWQYDHERDRHFELAGWRVLAYTWQDTTEGKYHFVMQVGEILAVSPTRWKSAAR